MLDRLQKAQIIDLKRKGTSTRTISKKLGISRPTVSKYWNEAQQTMHALEKRGEDARTMQHELYLDPMYKTREGKRRTLTTPLLDRIKKLLEDDIKKNKALRWDKQKLTNKQIHQILQEEGYAISISSLNIELARLRKPYKNPTAFIKQYYDYGKRLEFDFGEVRLDLGTGVQTFYMAVFCAPASNFRWCFLYDNQKQPVFLDSHVKFFSLVGGIFETVVYDNMKNVVSKFEGKNGKRLNEELQKMASYYGYKISVTNCYAGNEKGSVERSVEVLRNRLFSLNQRFESLETAQKYADSELNKINKDSGILIEKDYLSPLPAPYELAEFSEGLVSIYGFVSIDSNRYSVPEKFVGKRVSIKKYHDEIKIYFDFAEIARHKRSKNKKDDIVNIMHFLDGLERKPAAIKHSLALRCIPKLKDLFDKHFTSNPRKFIEILKASGDVDKAVTAINQMIKNQDVKAKSVTAASVSTDAKTKSMLEKYSELGRISQ